MNFLDAFGEITHVDCSSGNTMDMKQIVKYESGELNHDETLKMFQDIYDTRSYTWLQGSYGRILNELIEQGVIKTKEDKE